MSSLGEQIAAARRAAGLTQEQLADAIHVARNTVSTWEHGRSQPDVETLRRLSEILQFDFLTGQPAVSPEAVPAPKNKKLFAVLAIVLCLIALAGALWIWQPRVSHQPQPTPTATPVIYQDDAGQIYAIDDYRAVAPKQEGKAYLSITPTLTIQNPGEQPFWAFTFKINESNGIPFSIGQIELAFFSRKRISVERFNGADFPEVGLASPDLPAYGVFSFTGGLNARNPAGQPNGLGVGFKVYGVDANGESMVFTSYLPFPQD